MGQTVFTGPVLTGDLQQGQANGPNQGYCELMQYMVITQAGVGTQNYTMYLPAGSTINDILVDVTTAWDSATSAALTIGNTPGGTQYAPSVNLKTAGRAAITYTAAQLAAMDGVTLTGGPAPMQPQINLQVVTVGATANGAAVVTVRYSQLTSSN